MVLNSQSLSKEQVLIVGCGDIGQRLAQYLPDGHYDVTGLRRSALVNTTFLRYQQCDVTNRDEFASILKHNFSVIVITMTPTERSDAGYQRAYVQTCQNLVDILNKQSLTPRLLVFVSSTAVYGQTDGSWVDENSITEPEGFSGKRLLQAEAIISASDCPSTVVRFSGIYGPGRNRLIEQVRQGKASASIQITNRIHADDCARVLAHLIETNRRQENLAPIYVATDCMPAPMIEVVSWLADQMDISTFLSDAAVNERGNKRCSNRRLLSSGFSFRYPDFKQGYSAVLVDSALAK